MPTAPAVAVHPLRWVGLVVGPPPALIIHRGRWGPVGVELPRKCITAPSPHGEDEPCARVGNGHLAYPSPGLGMEGEHDGGSMA